MKNDLTKYWKTFLHIPSASFSKSFGAISVVLLFNRKLTIARLHSSLQQLSLHSSLVLKVLSRTIGPFRIILSTPDSVIIYNEGILNTLCIESSRRASDAYDTKNERDRRNNLKNSREPPQLNYYTLMKSKLLNMQLEVSSDISELATTIDTLFIARLPTMWIYRRRSLPHPATFYIPIRPPATFLTYITQIELHAIRGLLTNKKKGKRIIGWNMEINREAD